MMGDIRVYDGSDQPLARQNDVYLEFKMCSYFPKCD